MDGLAALIARNTAENGESVWLEDARSERIVSFSAVTAALASWDTRLAAAGVAVGGSVVIDVGDPLDFALAHISAIASGRRSVPTNPDLTDHELKRICGLLEGAFAVITDRNDRSVP